MNTLLESIHGPVTPSFTGVVPTIMVKVAVSDFKELVVKPAPTANKFVASFQASCAVTVNT